MTPDFSRIMDVDAQEQMDTLNGGEDERLCVACNFRLAQEDSLFCDRVKCSEGSTVYNAAGEILFQDLICDEIQEMEGGSFDEGYDYDDGRIEFLEGNIDDYFDMDF